MTEWARTIATVDRRIEQTIHDGLFELAAERRFVVTDEYDDGAEFVTVTRGWAGTMVDDALAELVGAQSHAVRLHQEVGRRQRTRRSWRLRPKSWIARFTGGPALPARATPIPRRRTRSEPAPG